MTRPRPLVVALALATVPLLGCEGVARYSVTQTSVDDCIIRANGEFCDEEDTLAPPTVETYILELLDEETLIYIGEETWIADGIEGERTVVKEERLARSLCTTTTTRTLVFDTLANADTGAPELVGSFEERVRVDGPDSCGETPYGWRKRYSLFGVQGGAL
jgi:hypothetical protein